ncbi:MAG: hypothetical protein HYV33_00815 [Candidatus Kerfeldbacteria bacterium]|nr:hypothetical protein [Candidatus Kerfeldbacteria bacterium]
MEIAISIATTIGSWLLGFFVFFRDKKSATNVYFALMMVLVGCYSIFNYLSLHSITNEVAFFWAKFILYASIFIGPLLYFFVSTFPGTKFFFSKKIQIPIIIWLSINIVLVALNLVFKSVTLDNGSLEINYGPLLPSFGFLQVATILMASIVLIKRYIKAKGILKIQLKFITFGIVISFILALLVTLILPLLGVTYLIALSPFFFLTAGIAVAYSIVRHHLFNIKVIATEALVIVIWIILFSKVFVSNSAPERIVDVLTLSITILFGILLIRSVIKEVRLAEQQYEMVATVSHQLRTPLTPVLGYAAMMDQGDFDGNPKELKDAEHNLFIATQRLRNIINDFLQIFELEGEHKIDVEKTTLKQLVADAIAGVEENYKQKNLYLKLENPNNVDATVSGDVKLLVQAVNNLLDNAQRYTQEGGTTVTVGMERGRAIIKVHDTGIGLDDKDKDRLFSKFYRSDAAKEVRPDGSGLGLPIVKNVVEAHGGRVRAESEGRGKGTTFIIELPIKGK